MSAVLFPGKRVGVTSCSSESSSEKRSAAGRAAFEDKPKVEPRLIGGSPMKDELRLGVSASI